MLAGLRALNRSAWTDNLRGSNINTWVRGRFAKPEPNYADPLGGPLSVTPPPPPPPPPPPVGESVSKTVYQRPPVKQSGPGAAKQSEFSEYTLSISKIIDEEFPHVNVSMSGEDVDRIVDMQVVARRKVDPNNKKALLGSTNGWHFLLCFESDELLTLVAVNEGHACDIGSNTIRVRTDSTGRCRLHVEAANWDGVRVYTTGLSRVGDLITVESGDAPGLMLPSGFSGGGA